MNITLSELDVETESVKITIVGTNLNFEEIKKLIESLGGVVHSVDEVVAGKRLWSPSRLSKTEAKFLFSFQTLPNDSDRGGKKEES